MPIENPEDAPSASADAALKRARKEGGGQKREMSALAAGIDAGISRPATKTAARACKAGLLNISGIVEKRLLPLLFVR
jgi:hypothetical protein